MSQYLSSPVAFADLSALCIAETAFREISSELDVYCPFEALGVSRHEIRHSNFLANILTPSNPHGFGDGGIRIFLDTLLSSIEDDQARLKFHLVDIGRCEIYREWKHIDLICYFPELSPPTIVVLEIKVESGEHGDQLLKYEKLVKNQWPEAKKLFFFLTPNGAEASVDTWSAISFGDLLNGLERLLADNQRVPVAAMMLRAYIAMMRRRYVPNDNLEDLARQIWAKHALTLEYLIDQRPDVLRDASAAMREKEFPALRDDILSKIGIEIELEKSSNTYLQIAIPKWDSNPNMLKSTWTTTKRLLLCQIEFYGNRVHVRMLLGQGDQPAREQLWQQLKKCSDVDYGKRKTLTPKWSRLASKTLISGKELDDIRDNNDVTLLLQKSKDGIKNFLIEHLPAYDRALS